ncbi:hypothetical protein [Spartinivicinus ruber]|uniref:hypothetical protein n=1 Tax=Spartinivicinus ruber TaxID=2683272 RepID=UPI0013D7D51E|nr:hypothetical protein [Spartinivicinus ruber]
MKTNKIKLCLAFSLLASTVNAASTYTMYDKMDYGFNGCDISWGTLQTGVTEEDMITLAKEVNAFGFTYHPSLKYGKLMVGPYPSGCKSPANESWPLYLSRTRAYKKMDFGFNRCDTDWGPLQSGVTEEDMIALALETNAEGFTYHPMLRYGKVLVGTYPAGCESPANESWPLYLSEIRTYKQMSFGFNRCDVQWGPLQRNVSEADMIKLAEAANAEGFTYHSSLKYGKVLVGAYPMDCQSPANESWPLYLAE